MPQLDILTYWIFGPLYYIWVNLFILICVFSETIFLFFALYKCMPKEIHYFLTIILYFFNIFLYRLFYLYLHLYSFFNSIGTLKGLNGLVILDQPEHDETPLEHFIGRLFDYWIVAIQGGFGKILKWCAMIIPGEVLVAIGAGIYCLMFSKTVSFQTQFFFLQFGLFFGIFLFRFGLLDPFYIWNIYDPSLDTRAPNEWEDVMSIDLKPWHLTTLFGVFVLVVGGFSLKYFGYMLLPHGYFAFPNLFFYEDFWEFYADHCPKDIYVRSYKERKPTPPFPPCELETRYDINEMERDLYRQADLAFSKVPKTDESEEIYNDILDEIKEAGMLDRDRLDYDGHYNLRPFDSALRVAQLRRAGKRRFTWLYRHDPTFEESRFREVLLHAPIWYHKKFIKDFNIEHGRKATTFLQYLYYPGLWTNRHIKPSAIANPALEIDYAAYRPAGNGKYWLHAGYLVDNYQRQLLSIRKFYRYYFTYSDIVWKMEKREITIPELRILAELSFLSSQKKLNMIFKLKRNHFAYWLDYLDMDRIADTTETQLIQLKRADKRFSSKDYYRLYAYRDYLEKLLAESGQKLRYILKDYETEIQQMFNSLEVAAEQDLLKLDRYAGLEGERLRIAFLENEKKDEWWLDGWLLDNGSFQKFAIFSKYEQVIEEEAARFKVLSEIVTQLRKNPPRHWNQPNLHYLRSYGSDLPAGPLAVDKELQFMEWHPRLGTLTEEDFQAQSPRSLIVAHATHEIKEHVDSSFFGLIKRTTWTRKPCVVLKRELAPSRTSNKISQLAVRNNYEQWHRFYRTRKSLSDRYGYTSSLLAKSQFRFHNLSTHSVLTQAIKNKVLFGDGKFYPKDCTFRIPERPEYNYFFPWRLIYNYDFYRKFKKGLGWARVDLPYVFWFDSSRVAGVPGYTVVERPEVKFASIGGLPFHVVEQRLIKRFRRSVTVWTLLDPYLPHWQPQDIYSYFINKKWQKYYYSVHEQEVYRFWNRILKKSKEIDAKRSSEIIEQIKGRLMNLRGRKKPVFILRWLYGLYVYTTGLTLDIVYAIAYLRIWYRSINMIGPEQDTYIRENFHLAKSHFSRVDHYWFLTFRERQSVRRDRFRYCV